MSGNVSEWVADVYRPNIDNEANDFNYYRGNIYTQKVINKEGKVVIAGSSDQAQVEYDTLPNGRIIPKQFPGSIKYKPISKKDIGIRSNFNVSDNSDIGDGDIDSSRFYDDDEDQFASRPAMYNSPEQNRIPDDKKRTTLISNKTRVYKGGSWSDREYWLDPAQRRYLPQFMARNDIGFRCATDMLGNLNERRTARNSSR
jgi:gliding motility-associated lipoprotein GldJ